MSKILSDAVCLSYWGLDPKITFTNHGSYGAYPEPVRLCLADYHQEIAQCPDAFFWFNYREKLKQVRQLLADFLTATFDNLVLVPNVTFAVNSIFRSLPFESGQEILVTNHNYGACRNVIEYVARRYKLEVIEVNLPFTGLPEEEIITAILEKCSPKTVICFIDHLASASSFLFPVKAIVEALKNRGIPTFIDGAHAPGQIELNLDNIGAAFYAGNLHKWAASPRGTAFIYVSPEFQTVIEPAVISWGSSESVRGNSTTLAEKFAFLGTVDLAPFLSIPTAIEFLKSAYPGGFEAFLQFHQHLAQKAVIECQKYFDLPQQDPLWPAMFYSVQLPFPVTSKLETFLQQQEEIWNNNSAQISRNLFLSHSLFQDYCVDGFLQVINQKYVIRMSSYCYNSLEDYQTLWSACEDLIVKRIGI